MSIHVPANGGVTKWFNGDIVSAKLTAEQTGGELGLVEAICPPGGGPIPHIHYDHDETFYLVSGELEFLQGDRMLTAGAGDVVYIKRGLTHRFYNPGIRPATMLFVYTPGGPESLFVEGGDEPQPAVQVQPWGPKRIAELGNLLVKYDTTIAMPEGK